MSASAALGPKFTSEKRRLYHDYNTMLYDSLSALGSTRFERVWLTNSRSSKAFPRNKPYGKKEKKISHTVTYEVQDYLSYSETGYGYILFQDRKEDRQ